MVPSNEMSQVDRTSAAAQPAGLFIRRQKRPIGFADNREPDLAEVLTDPIILRLLRSDGIHRDHLIDLIADIRVKLARRNLASI